MKPILALVFWVGMTHSVGATDLFIRTFGQKSAKPLLFLHGGPGYNSASFEATTAQSLSENGYFVIVYDRRGEGRSVQHQQPAAYTFEQTFADINHLLDSLGVSTASLMGHSFGGVLATLYAERYPHRVEKIFLISTPVSMQQTFKTVLRTSKKLYEQRRDTVNLNYLGLIDQLDTTSMEYGSYTLMHAMQNGFYTAKKPDRAAIQRYRALLSDSLYKYTSQMTRQAPRGFLQNERYTSIDLTTSILKLRDRGIGILGMYGKDDGLYSSQQVRTLEGLIGAVNVLYLENCSHNIFIDRQDGFLAAVNGF